MGRARDGRGTLIVTLLAALVLAVVSVVHSPPTAGACVGDAVVQKEIGGRDGPEPTRYGDWEKNGRCIDF